MKENHSKTITSVGIFGIFRFRGMFGFFGIFRFRGMFGFSRFLDFGKCLDFSEFSGFGECLDFRDLLKRVRSVRWRVFFTLVPPGGKASERSERSMTFLLLEGGREGKSLQNDYLRWDFRNFQYFPLVPVGFTKHLHIAARMVCRESLSWELFTGTSRSP